MSAPFTTAQMNILAALSKSPAKRTATSAFPEGMDGRAMSPLMNAGYVEFGGRGIYVITAKGRAAFARAFNQERWAARKANR